MKWDWARQTRKIWPLMFMGFVTFSTAFGSEQTREAIFQYAGGTDKIEQDCAGKLEVTMEGLVFRCPGNSVDMPFATITLMQFRPDVSPRVRSLKLKWATFPSIIIAGKQNRYFTVVAKKQGVTQVMVLRTDPLSMRPYLAEIELKSGRRVEVMPYSESLQARPFPELSALPRRLSGELPPRG